MTTPLSTYRRKLDGARWCTIQRYSRSPDHIELAARRDLPPHATAPVRGLLALRPEAASAPEPDPDPSPSSPPP